MRFSIGSGKTNSQVAKAESESPNPVYDENNDFIDDENTQDQSLITQEKNPTVLFETNSYEISPEYQKTLDQLIEKLNTSREFPKLTITGHTDSVGSYEYNLDLSRKRAEAVKHYFIQNGISAEKLEVVGESYSDPVAENSTESGRSMNRRAEITFSPDNSGGY